MFTGQFGHMCLRYKQTVFKLEASRLGHKTGKPHGLQIGSIKFGA